MNLWTQFHASTVSGLAFTPDGQEIISCGYDGWMKRFRTNDGVLLAGVPVGMPGVSQPEAMAANHNTVAIALNDGTVKQFIGSALANHWRACTGLCTAVAISPDGKLIAVGCGDALDAFTRTYFVRVLNAIDGAVVKEFKLGLDKYCKALAFSPDGESLVFGDTSVQGAVLSKFKVSDWSPEWSFTAHTNSILCCQFSPDGTMVASGGADMTVRLWSAASGVKARVFGPFSDAVNAFDWQLDSRSLILTTWSKHVIVVNLSSSTSFNITDTDMPTCIRFQPGRPDRYAIGRGQNYSVSYCNFATPIAPPPTTTPVATKTGKGKK